MRTLGLSAFFFFTISTSGSCNQIDPNRGNGNGGTGTTGSTSGNLIAVVDCLDPDDSCFGTWRCIPEDLKGYSFRNGDIINIQEWTTFTVNGLTEIYVHHPNLNPSGHPVSHCYEDTTTHRYYEYYKI